MALNYEETAKKIIEAVGGESNIASATHCMTRLRLVLNDEGKANDEVVKKIKGVKSVIKQGGQYQIVIGNEVSNLYKVLATMGNFTEDSNADPKKVEGNVIQRLFGFIAGCMTPLLPAMLGAGMIKVLLTLLTTFNLMSSAGSTYTVLYGLADAFFYFLPLFLSVSIAKKVKGSIPLFMSIGAMLCYPDLVAMLAGGVEGIQYGTFLGMDCTYIFGVIPVIEATYTSSVLPILLMTPVMIWAEKFADRVSPNMVKAFLKPMLFMLICAPVLLVVLGPIGAVCGNLLSMGVTVIYNACPWLSVALLSAAMPFIVMTGMHYALIPICFNNMATIGYDVVVIVTMFASNLAQGGAALGVAAKTKNSETRSEGLASGISAIVAGVTEPAMYGINLRFGKPMAGAVIGAGLSGLFLGLTGVKGWTMGGSPSVFTLINFIGGEKPMMGVVFGSIALIISVGVAFAYTLFAFKDEAEEEEEAVVETVATEVEDEKKIAINKIEIAAPMTGDIVKLSEVPDQVFSSEAIGEGIAIMPADGNVYAPADGTVTVLMDTKHAVGLKTDDGVEILIHIGIDTVKLEGKPFDCKVSQGQKIKKGDLLLTADLNMIKEAGCPLHTPVVVSNSNDYVSIKSTEAAKVQSGETLMTIV